MLKVSTPSGSVPNLHKEWNCSGERKCQRVNVRRTITRARESRNCTRLWESFDAVEKSPAREGNLRRQKPAQNYREAGEGKTID
jgi:hypothetical protein